MICAGVNEGKLAAANLGSLERRALHKFGRGYLRVAQTCQT